MMQENDLTYYERRLAEELAAWERSEMVEVRAIHRKLADMYRQRIVELSPKMRAY